MAGVKVPVEQLVAGVLEEVPAVVVVVRFPGKPVTRRAGLSRRVYLAILRSVSQERSRHVREKNEI